jgi:hypothetical protein
MEVIKSINLPNGGKKQSIDYSQFCMAAVNENVLVNVDKSKRLFYLLDYVSKNISDIHLE